MPDDRLAKIKARLAKATPGPWETRAHEHPQAGCRCLSCDVITGWRLDHPSWVPCDETPAMAEANRTAPPDRRQEDCLIAPMPWADADFAAHAAEDIAWLLERLAEDA